MNRSLRVVITFAFVPAGVAAVILGLATVMNLSSVSVFAVLVLPTAAGSYWLLRSADMSSKFATGGALAVTALSYVLAIAFAIEYLVN